MILSASTLYPSRFMRWHTLRHSSATDLLESSYDIRTVQDLLGHNDVRTTMIHSHVSHRGPKGVKSPVDNLRARRPCVLCGNPIRR